MDNSLSFISCSGNCLRVWRLSEASGCQDSRGNGWLENNQKVQAEIWRLGNQVKEAEAKLHQRTGTRTTKKMGAEAEKKPLLNITISSRKSAGKAAPVSIHKCSLIRDIRWLPCKLRLLWHFHVFFSSVNSDINGRIERKESYSRMNTVFTAKAGVLIYFFAECIF